MSRPYCLYWNRGFIFDSGFQQTDKNGFRYKGYDVVFEKNQTRILAYGGSTTFSNHVLKDPRECWPHMLQSRFDEIGVDVEIVNCGLNYGLTSDLVSHFILEGLHFNPDVVILHGPGNDMLPISSGDLTPDYRLTRRSVFPGPRVWESRLLKFSGLAQVIYAIALRKTAVVQFEPKEFDSINIQNDRMLETDLRSFKNNVRIFADVCIARNIKLVLVDFVQTSEELLELQKPGLSQGMIKLVSEMNRYFEELATESPLSILHVPLETEEMGKDNFVDTCHLNLEGEINKAESIFNYVRNIFEH